MKIEYPKWVFSGVMPGGAFNFTSGDPDIINARKRVYLKKNLRARGVKYDVNASTKSLERKLMFA